VSSGSAINITGNSIYDMAQTNTHAGVNIAGIYLANAPDGTNIVGNTISQQPVAILFTTVPTTGATSATLSSSWSYPWQSGSWLVTFSDGEQRTCVFTQGSATITWTGALTGTTFTINAVVQDAAMQTGIYVFTGLVSAANLTITGNIINIANVYDSTQGIAAYAHDYNIQTLTISGNTIQGCASGGISLQATSGNAIEVFTIAGNTISGGAATSVPLSISGAEYGSVTGNTLNALSTDALTVSGSTTVRISGNMMLSSGSQTASFSGTCTGSIFDESNSVNGTINNSASGLNVRQLGSATPTGWTSQAGDVIYNTSPGSSTWTFAWQYSASGTWVGLTIP
jgi:hypothetical protein